MADNKFLISRDRLATFIKDNDTLRRFEKLFQTVNIDNPANFTIIFRLLQELAIDIVSASSSAIAASDTIARLTAELDQIRSAPMPDGSVTEYAARLADSLDTQLGTVNAKANRLTDLVAALSRTIETDPESIRAAINSVSSVLSAFIRNAEADTGSLWAAINQLNDGLTVLARSFEVDASRSSFQMPRTFSIDYIDWDQNPAASAQTARMEWNTADDTLNLHHSDGVTQQMGQELYGRILNNTGITIPNGSSIGINPATNSYVLFIANGTLSPITIVGVTTQDIPNGAFGRITVWGRVRDINTTGAPFGEAWVAGQILYVSTTIAGGFTNVKPTAPNLSLPIAQVLTINATTGQIAVRPTVEQQLFYGQFAKTSDQIPSAVNTADAVLWDSSLIANGVTIGAPASRIVAANAGLYKFSASFQLTSSSASVKNVWFWFRKNGVDVPNSALITSLDSGTAIRSPSRSLFFSLAAGDYIELMWASDSVNATLDNIAATAFAPAAPAALLTVNQEQQ